ncbi:MAG: DUF4430 domain-containing protein [Candidatus Heimdallarchaeota archaeon]|nr:DUF4430 domain-containing protein [Candidatus Heimdallarchaeota archaeon]MCK5048350.1 DUF4430 domain-containing protein [Candidatus Heimdallarchaeota archaeon]
METKNIVILSLITFSSIIISGLLILGPYGIDFFQTEPENELDSFNVTLSIDYNGYLPAFGPQRFTINSSDTVLDLLKMATNIGTQNYGLEILVTSINNTSNNQDNNQLFWQFWVNDKYSSLGAGRFILTPNDFVEWRYTGY